MLEYNGLHADDFADHRSSLHPALFRDALACACNEAQGGQHGEKNLKE